MVWSKLPNVLRARFKPHVQVTNERQKAMDAIQRLTEEKEKKTEIEEKEEMAVRRQSYKYILEGKFKNKDYKFMWDFFCERFKSKKIRDRTPALGDACYHQFKIDEISPDKLEIIIFPSLLNNLPSVYCKIGDFYGTPTSIVTDWNKAQQSTHGRIEKSLAQALMDRLSQIYHQQEIEQYAAHIAILGIKAFHGNEVNMDKKEVALDLLSQGQIYFLMQMTKTGNGISQQELAAMTGHATFIHIHCTKSIPPTTLMFNEDITLCQIGNTPAVDISTHPIPLEILRLIATELVYQQSEKTLFAERALERLRKIVDTDHSIQPSALQA